MPERGEHGQLGHEQQREHGLVDLRPPGARAPQAACAGSAATMRRPPHAHPPRAPSASLATAARMIAPCSAPPSSADAEERQRGAEVPRSATPSSVPSERPAPAADGGAAHHDRGDHLQLEADRRAAVCTSVNARRSASPPAPSARPAARTPSHDDPARRHAEQPRGLRVAADRVHGAAGARDARSAQAHAANTDGGRRHDQPARPATWPRPSHWKPRGQSQHVLRPACPAQAFAQRGHRREGHHDRGQAARPRARRSALPCQRRPRQHERHHAASAAPALASMPAAHAARSRTASRSRCRSGAPGSRASCPWPRAARRVVERAGRASCRARKKPGAATASSDQQRDAGPPRPLAPGRAPQTRTRLRGRAERQRQQALGRGLRAQSTPPRRCRRASPRCGRTAPAAPAARTRSRAPPGPGRPARRRAVDLGLGADVDSLRRLVQDQDRGTRRQRSGAAPPSAGCRPRASPPAPRATRPSPAAAST